MEKGFFLPTKYFLTAGSSYGDTELVAFDLALINAGIANLNLIKLSSILAPMCQRIPKTKIELGAFIGVAYAKNVGTHTGETISSAIAIGHPSDKSKASLIMEYSSSMNAVESDRVVREMVKPISRAAPANA